MTDTISRPVFDATLEEPRLHARRVEVRKATRRRRRRIAGALVAVVALAGAGVATLYSPLFDIDHLDIEGVRHLDPAAVADASGLATGQQLVDLDTDGAEARLSKLPWVANVTVTRRWPDTVEVRIGERRAVATVVTASGPRVVVTADGIVAGEAGPLDASLPASALDPAVPVKVGRPLPKAIAAAVAMVGALPLDLASKATGAVIDARGHVSVGLQGGATLVLGTGEQAAEKFIAAQSILGGSVALGGLERADVSVPSAPVINRGA